MSHDPNHYDPDPESGSESEPEPVSPFGPPLHERGIDEFAGDPVIDLPVSNKRRKTRRGPRSRKRRLFALLCKCSAFLLVLLLVAGMVGAAGAYFYCKPRYDLAQTFDLSELGRVEVASRIFDRNGEELGRIFVQNRRPVPLDEVSNDFINALLASEDSRFYQHNGVDFLGIARAVFYGLRSKEWNQGASTITQQLGRQAFELKDRTLSRKVTEIFLAQRIEREIGDKEKILELYVNRIYFGSGYYGIAAAAEGYFGKDPSRISVVEGATLAATVPNPYHRSPRNFPEASVRWRNHILGRMEIDGFIDREARERYQRAELATIARSNITGRSAFVYEEVRQQVSELLGSDATVMGGFQIHTTIDGGVQDIAERLLREQLDKIEQHPDFNHSTRADYKAEKAAFQESAHPEQQFPAPTYLQGALLMIDNKTGATLARIGGRDFSDSMFDRVSQGRRPVGTAFKPFVYAAAMESGFFPGTLVDDTPLDAQQVQIGGMTGILGEWGPEDFENVYENVITARRALARSKNAATVRLGQRVGLEAVVNLAKSAGMSFEGDLKNFNATFLGRNPASPEDVCLAYTVFPNNGRRPSQTYIISEIRDSRGNVIYTPRISMEENPAVDRHTAFQISSMLADSFDYGTARRARERFGLGDFPVAGKSGTEYNFTDNWFVGYTSEVTCVVWAGFDRTRSIYPLAFSTETVLPVWTEVMNAAAERYEPKAFLPPPDSEQVEICLKSGELASDACYETVEKGDGMASQVRTTYIEHLRPGTRLETICHVHGRPGSRLRDLTQQPQRGPLVARYVVHEEAEAVFPVAPTVVGTDDPYNSVAPVLRARVAAVTAEPVEPSGEEDAPAQQRGGLPVATPVLNESEEEALPGHRVQLPRPRAIEFD